MPLIEERLRSLMLRSLAGDASSYHIFLRELATHLRSFLRNRMARLPEILDGGQARHLFRWWSTLWPDL